jgi:D-alanine-D-alanine ligase
MAKRAVIFGGPSPEHDISISTGLQTSHTAGDVEAIYWYKTGRFHLVDPASEVSDFVDGVPRKATPLTFVAEPGRGFVQEQGGFAKRQRPLDVSVILNCCHGGPGEDGTLQGMLDLAGYRYSGPGQAGSSLGMDKLAFGAAVAQIGLPTLPRTLLAADRPPRFDGPYIVKPRYGGSSIGIEVVEDHATAVALLRTPNMADGAVVEPFLEDFRDLQVAIRTYPEPELSAVEEPVVSAGGLYSYQQKYLAWSDAGGAIQRKLPADVTPELLAELRKAAFTVADLVGVRSVARIDFLEQNGALWVNEINTIPGSLSSYLWIDPEIERARLVEDVFSELEQARPRAFTTAGADGSALRNAGSIAGKLG